MALEAQSQNTGAGRWPDGVDEILGSDQVIALAYVTPARGTVVTPVTNFGLRDRDQGVLSAVNSSVGVHKKLERIRRHPKVALAYHTRHLSFSDRFEYVMVQGEARLGEADPDYTRRIRNAWEQFGGPVETGRLWSWWLRAYDTRIPIHLAVHRLMVWPDLECRGAVEVLGPPLPADPPPQRPPRDGTGPRVDHTRAAERAAALPDTLLGWVDSEDFPVIVPARVAGPEPDGISLELPAGLAPAGGRRAGMISHSFARYTAGQTQRKHTGWLEVAEAGAGRALYAPHTDKGYRMPSSMLAYRAGAGFMTRRGYPGARRAGLVPGAGR